MKKLESIQSLKASKLSKGALSKFHGGGSDNFTEIILGPHSYEYVNDSVKKKGERALTR